MSKEKVYVSDLPNLLLDWDTEKNVPLTPYEVTIGSGKKVFWRCHVCGYEWTASINNRAKGRGCSSCSNRILIEGVNDFATIYPKAATEWDYEKNYPLTPNKVFANSNKKYWFRCEKGHVWETSLNLRRRNNCPYCGNQRVLKGYNDLASRNPLLCEEWNYEKNAPLTPDQVMKFSNKKVWWKCKICGYEWLATISNRSLGTDCPKCKNDYKTSESERIIYYYIKKQFDDAIISYRPEWLRNREIDIYIPSLRLALEYDGEVWHRDIQRDIDKTIIIIENGISLIRIREENCCAINDESYSIKVNTHNYKYSRLNNPIKKIFDYINKRYHLSIVCDIDVERDYQDILAMTLSDKQDKSLLTNYKELCEEWNYSRNKIMPQNVLPGSTKKVWWKCKKCGYEWCASVNNRVKGRNCPLCSNKICIQGVNDLATTNPQLAEEWNYDKNYPFTARDFTAGSHKRIWWSCRECGHEWQTAISNRKHNNCPKCAIKKRGDSNIKNRVVVGENDLLSQSPEIARE